MDTGVLDGPRLRRLIDAGRALVSELDLDALLEQLLDVAAEVTGARYAALGILDEERRELERFLTRGIAPEVHRAIGDLPRGRGILGVLIDEPRPLRLPSLGRDPRSFGFPPSHPEMDTFLGTPVLIRGEAWGNLYLTEKEGGGEFTAADEEAVVVLAEWAGIAIGNARSVQAERLRHSLAAAEAERSRWARELHDETLQGLGGLRMLVSAARRRADASALDQVLAQIDVEIENLRMLIRELRPAALDELGAAPAIEELAARIAARHGIEVATTLELSRRHGGELETALYRIIQEALTNAVKHAGARRVTIDVREAGDAVRVTVADDGSGFDPAEPSGGFGLIGMRERVELLGGELELASSGAGTRVAASLPFR